MSKLCLCVLSLLMAFSLGCGGSSTTNTKPSDNSTLNKVESKCCECNKNCTCGENCKCTLENRCSKDCTCKTE